MKKLVILVIILAALVEIKSYVSSKEKALQFPIKDNSTRMWNGGKPSLPVQINMIEDQLRVATGLICQTIVVKISGSDGLIVKNNINEEINCEVEKEKTYNLELDKKFAGTGFVVVEVQVINVAETKTITKAFAFSGLLKNDILTKSIPAVKDQYGVLYHEFPSSDRR